MTNLFYRLLLSVTSILACANVANAQLPNEKFGKPSTMEWEFTGWGDAIGADAIILCKTMKATYQLTDQVDITNLGYSDVNFDNLRDFGKNNIDESNILVNYEVKLRTKILNPEGAKHANIDITYYSVDDNKIILGDELSDLSVRVFTKNEKGKVVKKNINTASFKKERIDKNYMVLHVVVPEVQPGSIVEYQYKITSIRPVFLYDWVFQEDIPTVRSKCDIEIPAFLKFDMNAPINKLIKSSVEAGQLAYDINRADFKRGKTCVTNHYIITGDYILPEGYALKHNQGNDASAANAEETKIANFTSRINMPNTTLPAYIPEGHTHLKVK